jgi:acetyl esterase/lipase
MPENVYPYGRWPSAITAELITSDSLGLGEIQLVGGDIYYIERRPREKGRCVIVRHSGGRQTDILPAGYSARSRVHEYGGGSFLACAAGVFFVNDSDQDIYQLEPDSHAIRRLTREQDMRFADMDYDARRKRLVAICEQHGDDVINTIVSIDLVSAGNDSCTITPLAQGADFYASPRLSPDCHHLCWQSWCFPAMPWDGNELTLAMLDERGMPASASTIAGSDKASVFQPLWLDDDNLAYICDDTGWWQLYRYTLSATDSQQLTFGEREFGLPQWVFRQSSYCALDDTHLLCSYRSPASPEPGNRLLYIDLDTGHSLDIESPWQEHDQLAGDRSSSSNTVALIAASSDCFPQLVTASLCPQPQGQITLDTRVITTSCSLPVSDGYYASARKLRFQNRHGQEVFASYYPPTNPDITTGADDSRPPLIVICHGGPTGQSSTALDPRKLFWTSRGYALLDVDYSGSTGYGRAYRERLNGQWGKLDVEDCCDAALFAVSAGLADADRLIIRGSSAGGLTVLAALTFHDVFAAGACYYGISDLAGLADATHKFESRYNDIIIGPYPETKALYRERSPIHHSDQLNKPVIFFQGVDDCVVPMAQTQMMVSALRDRGIRVAAQYFAGEQHGFRQSSTIENCLENELTFYRLVMDIDGEDDAVTMQFRGDIELSNM